MIHEYLFSMDDEYALYLLLKKYYRTPNVEACYKSRYLIDLLLKLDLMKRELFK